MLAWLEDTIREAAAQWWVLPLTAALCLLDGVVPVFPSESVIVALASIVHDGHPFSLGALWAAGFLGAFRGLDEVSGLAALASIPTLVLCGSDDLMTPMRHSETLAAHLPDARLVRVAQAGHMVILERAHEVAEAIVELVTAARRAHVGDLALAR